MGHDDTPDEELPFYAPDRYKTQLPPKGQPGELLFEFLIGHDRMRCELRSHGGGRIEAQILRNEEIEICHMFDESMDRTRSPREMAIGWLKEERAALERNDA